MTATAKRRVTPRPKHVPMRTCVVCRANRPKRDLARIVRALDGSVVYDPTGKLNGRGAYLCRQRSCWQTAFKRKTLNHALQTTVTAADAATLATFAETLPETLPSTQHEDAQAEMAAGEHQPPANDDAAR